MRDNKVVCIVLYCIVLYCIVLYCIVLYCIVLYCIVLYCIVLYCIVSSQETFDLLWLWDVNESGDFTQVTNRDLEMDLVGLPDDGATLQVEKIVPEFTYYPGDYRFADLFTLKEFE